MIPILVEINLNYITLIIFSIHFMRLNLALHLYASQLKLFTIYLQLSFRLLKPLQAFVHNLQQLQGIISIQGVSNIEQLAKIKKTTKQESNSTARQSSNSSTKYKKSRPISRVLSFSMKMPYHLSRILVTQNLNLPTPWQ